TCAERVLEANLANKRPLAIGLGLEAAAALSAEMSHVIALGATSYPLSGSTPELDRWLARHGRTPSWYEALGHAAATLAAAVLEALPAAELTERARVSAHHDAVRE